MVLDKLYNLVDLVFLSVFRAIIGHRDALFGKLRLLFSRALPFLCQTRRQSIRELYQCLCTILLPFFLICLIQFEVTCLPLIAQLLLQIYITDSLTATFPRLLKFLCFETHRCLSDQVFNILGVEVLQPFLYPVQVFVGLGLNPSRLGANLLTLHLSHILLSHAELLLAQLVGLGTCERINRASGLFQA